MCTTKNFRPYFAFSRFKLVTDHRPLSWIFNIKSTQPVNHLNKISRMYFETKEEIPSYSIPVIEDAFETSENECASCDHTVIKVMFKVLSNVF